MPVVQTGLGCLLLVSAVTASAQATLRRLDRQGRTVAECPLTHTSVQAQIAGMLARVIVTQEFKNPFAERIEAVYMPVMRSAENEHEH